MQDERPPVRRRPETRSTTRAARPRGRREDRRAVCEVTCVDAPKVARTRARLPAPATVAALADTFRALGDPTRLRLVAALAHEELCVCDLSTLLGVSPSAVSHSLRALRELRLVRYRRAGKIAFYTLDDAHIVTLLAQGVRHVEEAMNAGPVVAPE
jgi:DNA-binding transcriptional ArsR family regulator